MALYRRLPSHFLVTPITRSYSTAPAENTAAATAAVTNPFADTGSYTPAEAELIESGVSYAKIQADAAALYRSNPSVYTVNAKGYLVVPGVGELRLPAGAYATKGDAVGRPVIPKGSKVPQGQVYTGEKLAGKITHADEFGNLSYVAGPPIIDRRPNSLTPGLIKGLFTKPGTQYSYVRGQWTPTNFLRNPPMGYNKYGQPKYRY